MIICFASMVSDKIPTEVSKYFSRRNVDYSGPGILPENRRFSLIDGTVDGVIYDKEHAAIIGKNGWEYKCDSAPILLYEDKSKMLIFIEPGFHGTLVGNMYIFTLLDKNNGEVYFERKMEANPSSLMIFDKNLYVFYTSPKRKITTMSLNY